MIDHPRPFHLEECAAFAVGNALEPVVVSAGLVEAGDAFATDT